MNILRVFLIILFFSPVSKQNKRFAIIEKVTLFLFVSLHFMTSIFDARAFLGVHLILGDFIICQESPQLGYEAHRDISTFSHSTHSH